MNGHREGERTLAIFAGYSTVPDLERDRYVEAFSDLVQHARAFDGCIDVAITADGVDPGRVNIIMSSYQGSLRRASCNEG
jgi:hypothetical protein